MVAAPLSSNHDPVTHLHYRPTVPPAEHDIILDMLLSLLSPIAQHRALHITPSKGKRDKKRKRRQGQPDPPQPPPAPAIANHITVGLNSTTRHLERLVANKATPSHQDSVPAMPLILTTQSPSSPVVSHLPLLSSTASCCLPPSQATRIVPLSPSVETKLAAALGLPRVGVIGIKAGAPGTAPLIEYAQSNLQAVDVPWVREASAAVYKPVNVLAEVKGKGSKSA
ncbi:hypothetical protein HDK77DRAFT_148153 [Phyllosticta capitalensis]